MRKLRLGLAVVVVWLGCQSTPTGNLYVVGRVADRAATVTNDYLQAHPDLPESVFEHNALAQASLATAFSGAVEGVSDGDSSAIVRALRALDQALCEMQTLFPQLDLEGAPTTVECRTLEGK